MFSFCRFWFLFLFYFFFRFFVFFLWTNCVLFLLLSNYPTTLIKGTLRGGKIVTKTHLVLAVESYTCIHGIQQNDKIAGKKNMDIRMFPITRSANPGVRKTGFQSTSVFYHHHSHVTIQASVFDVTHLTISCDSTCFFLAQT